MQEDVFAEARRVLSSTNILSFVSNLLPHGKKEGNEWVSRNPNRNDQHLGSFKVNLTTGIWCDFSSGDKGDPIGLYAFVHRISDYHAACQIAGRDANITSNYNNSNYYNNHKNAQSSIDNSKQVAVEEELPRLTQEEIDELIFPPETEEIRDTIEGQEPQKVINNPPPITENDTVYHNKKFGGNPSAFYHYTDRDGATIGYIARYDFVNEKGESDKAFAPYTYNFEHKCWSGKKGFEAPRPLYNLHEITTNKSRKIIVNEGESSCLASTLLFPDHIATTSAFGANSPSKTDWKPLVGREVIIIPDHDIAGHKYAENVKKLCEKVGGFNSLTTFNTKLLGSYIIQNSEIVKRETEAPQGYDLADAVKDGWTVELIQQAIKDARFKELFKKTNVTQIIREELKRGEEELEFGNKRYKLTKSTLYLEELTSQPAMNEDGSIDMFSKKNILVPKFIPLCGYLKVTRKVRDGDDDNWGLTLNMVTSEGKEKEIYLKQQDVSKDGPIISFLLNKGLKIHNVTTKKRSNDIYEYINNSEPGKYALGVDKTGWHDNTYIMPYVDNRKNSYVINSGQQTNNEEFILQCDISALRKQKRKGTLQSWQENIGRYCKGNSRLVVACCAALTSTILSRVGEEGYCLHFAGSSSKGKSTTLYVASSIFGTGKPESFRATDNALESSCRNANDALLTLDELQEIDGNVIDKVIYMLSNGVGKLRARKDGTAQKPVSFTVLGITSGETGVAAKLAERHKTPTAGMGVRFIEILAEVDPELGIFENIYHFENAAVFAEHLQRSSLEHCGVVIDEFMKLLVANFDDILSRVIKLRDEWLKKYVTGNVDGQIRRVAKKFALQAAVGEIATLQGILPFEEGESVRSNKLLFDNWVAQRGGTGSFELQSIKNRLISFIQEERNARLLNANGDGFDKGIKSIAGFIKYDNSGMAEEYWLYPSVFNREIIQSPNVKFFYKELTRNGFIDPDKEQTTQFKRPSKVTPSRFIVIPASTLSKKEGNDGQ